MSRRALSARRVLVMGLGTKDGGVGAARYFASRGAEVCVTDRRPAAELEASVAQLAGWPIRYRLGGHDASDFRWADLVVRNVGVRRDHPLLEHARRSGALVRAPIGVFGEAVGPPFIGITGTKGKSFTTALVTHLLGGRAAGFVAAGNNCVSPLRHVKGAKAGVVLELSSWQLSELDELRLSPRIACFVSFFADHQDFYRGLERYFADKLAITRHQEPADVLVTPWDAPWVERVSTRARRVYFGRGRPPAEVQQAWFEDGAHLWCREGSRDHRGLPLEALPAPLQVPHLRMLLLAASAVARQAGVSVESIEARALTFAGLPHRMESLGHVEGTHFVNDSAATTPESTQLALDAMDAAPLVVIAGGGGAKSRCYRALAGALARRASAVVGFEDDEVGRQLALHLPDAFPFTRCAIRDVPGAVERAREQAGEGGCVLLSPACKGGPTFADMYERGDRFRDAVAELAS